MELNKIYQGDCLSFMKTFPDNSIDTIITDPPYHLTSIVKRFGKKGSAPAKYGTDGVFQRASKGFMGKEWDGGDIAFRVELWQEVLRVAKPGATLMAFGGTRTYHRMACAIEDAGWILRDCIMWLYGSGFPKATDIGKQLDKKAGKKREKIKRVRVDGKKPGIIDSYFGGKEFSPKETYSDKPATPEAKLWNGWKSHSLKPAYEPIIVAMKPNDGTYANNALKWGVSGLNIDAGRIGTEDTRQKTGGAIKGSGWGTKKGAIAGSSLGRFPANIILDEEAAKLLDEQSGVSKSIGGKIGGGVAFGKENQKGIKGNPGFNDKGGASRFFYVAKASKKERNMGTNNYLIINICVENMEQEELQKRDISELTEKWLIELYGKEKMEQYQMDISSTTKTETNKIIISIILNSKLPWNIKEYTLGAIKTRIKNGGSPVKNVENTNELKQIIINALTEYLLGVKAVASKTQLRISVNENNFHSTVKPLKLMEYLCKLTSTPTGGVVLDPFVGSGTTCMACKKLGRPYIGIEQDKEYCKIAEARIEAIKIDNKLF